MMVFNFFVGLADLYVAGFIGPDVQAAIGFVTQLFFIVIIFANAIGVGTVAMVSRAVGASNFTRAVEITRQSILFGIAVAAFITAATIIFCSQIMALAGMPGEIRAVAEEFLRIFAFALGPNYLLIIANSIFRAAGDVKKPLFTMFFVSVINIAGDFVLVFGIPPFPEMGYRGIAFSTASSFTAGMIISLVLLATKRWRGAFTGPWQVSFPTIARIVDIGWPSAFLQIAWQAGTLVLYNILSRLGEGTITALAALTNGLRIEAIIFLPAFALNMAASVLAGQNLGAGNPQRAEALGWKTAGAGIVLLSALALPIFIWAELFASILARTPEVLAETANYLRITMVSEPFLAVGTILSGAITGAGDTRATMWIIVACMWGIRLPLAYFLAITLGYGPTGVWIAMVASMICYSAFMGLRFRGGRWKHVRVD
ncbi:MAG TPA: MATE family efflux transporter [Syntrophales bacterium]|nr:MATE family efflux transporter [Syntrophales bacterium]